MLTLPSSKVCISQSLFPPSYANSFSVPSIGATINKARMAPSLLLLVVFSSSLLVLLPSPSVCAPGPQGAGSDNGDDDGDSVLATYVGSFRNYDHGIAGDVFVVDAKTLFIKDFSYDGDGPDAFFWASGTRRASSRGVIIPYPAGQNPPKKLGKYDKVSEVDYVLLMGILRPTRRKYVLYV